MSSQSLGEKDIFSGENIVLKKSSEANGAQDQFLKYCWRKQSLVKIVMFDNNISVGTIHSYDDVAILLEMKRNKFKLVYKKAVASITPEERFNANFQQKYYALEDKYNPVFPGYVENYS